MKVKVPGNLPKVSMRIMSGQCDFCGCVVECERREARLYQDQYTTFNRPMFFVKCPTEGCFVNIEVRETWIA